MMCAPPKDALSCRRSCWPMVRAVGCGIALSSLLIGIDAARTGAVASTRPDVLWTSSPTLPNETVLVTYTGVWAPEEMESGHPHSAKMHAELCRSVPEHPFDQCRATDLVMPQVRADNTTAAFVIPAAWSLGTFAQRLCSSPCATVHDCALHCSEWQPINGAQPRWALADRGSVLDSEHGQLSVFGRSLGFDDGNCIPAQALAPVASASIRLTPTSRLHQPVVLKGLLGTCYELRTSELPPIQPGQYLIEVQNGLDGAKWVPIPGAEITVVFNHVSSVVTYDVDADFNGNISAALEAAQRGSPGEVVLANNRTYEQDPHVTLQIPAGTVLRAKNSDGSHHPPTIVWTLPAPLRRGQVSGEGSTPCAFDLDNIALDLRVCPPLVYGTGNFSVIGVHLRAPALTPLLAIGDLSHGALVSVY